MSGPRGKCVFWSWAYGQMKFKSQPFPCLGYTKEVMTAQSLPLRTWILPHWFGVVPTWVFFCVKVLCKPYRAMSLNCVTAGISECLQSILWCPFVACFKAGGSGLWGQSLLEIKALCQHHGILNDRNPLFWKPSVDPGSSLIAPHFPLYFFSVWDYIFV